MTKLLRFVQARCSHGFSPKSDPRYLLPLGDPLAASIAEAPVPRSLPNSRKVYVTGSRPDLCVPMREIRLADSASRLGPVDPAQLPLHLGGWQ